MLSFAVIAIINCIVLFRVFKTESVFNSGSRKEKMNISVFYCSCTDDSLPYLGTVSTQSMCIIPCKPLNLKQGDRCEIKRWTVDNFKIDVLDDVELETIATVFKWRNGWTEQKAKDACMSYSNQSQLFVNCTSKLNIKPDFSLKTCLQDIRVFGSDLFLSSSLDFIQSMCNNKYMVIPKPTQATDKDYKNITKAGSFTPTSKQDDIQRNNTYLDIETFSTFPSLELVHNVNCSETNCSVPETCHQDCYSQIIYSSNDKKETYEDATKECQSLNGSLLQYGKEIVKAAEQCKMHGLAWLGRPWIKSRGNADCVI